MPIPLRLLLVEDNESDAERILHELRCAGFEPRCTRIVSDQEFITQLQAPLDLIIAEYRLPRFDGAQALRLLRESGLDVPFILVSGTIGEEVAVDAMRNGATDYLLKDRLARLGPSSMQALEQKRTREDRRRAEQAVRDSERRFRALIENSGDAVSLISPRGTILYESPSVTRILGYAVEERIGSNLFSRIHPDDLARVRAEFDDLLRERGARLQTEMRERHHDGSWHWIEVNAANLLAEPSVQAVVWNYRDTTERKRAEETLRRRAHEFATLYDTTSDLATQYDLSALLNTIADRARALLGATSSAMYLYDAARNDLVTTVVSNMSSVVGTRVQLGEGAAGRVAQSRQPLVLDDYRRWPHRLTTAAYENLRAVLQVPMLYQGELIGVLGVGEDGSTQRRFDQADQHLLSLFAAQAAASVFNARLLSETKRRAEQLAAINTLGRALTETLNLTEVYERLYETVHHLLPDIPNMLISRFDPAQNLIVWAYAVNDEQRLEVSELPSIPLAPPGRGPQSDTIHTREPQIVNDLMARTARSQSRYIRGDERPPRSALYLPMLAQGEVIGVLQLQSYELNRFSTVDVELLTFVANTAAIAIVNAGLFAQAQRRADEFAQLYEVTRDLARAQDLTALLATIAERARQFSRAHGSAIYLCDDARQIVELASQSGPSPFAAQLRWGEGMAGRVAATGEAHIVDDYHAWDHRYRKLDHTRMFHSVVGVPLQYAGSLIGVLVVVENTPQHQFTQADVRLLSLFASQAASAVHNARLLAETRRRLAEMEAVNHLSSALRSAQTLEQMLPIMLDETLSALRTDAGIIRLYEPATNLLRSAVARGWLTDVDATLNVNESIAGRVFTTDRAYVASDFHKDASISPNVRAQAPPGWSGVGVPVRSGHTPIGVLLVAMRLPRTIQPEELHLLSILGDIAGNAIHRARLYEEAERRVQHLSALHKVDMAITSSVDLRVTLNVLLDQITTQLDIHAAAVLLLDPHSQMLEYGVGRGFRSAGLSRTRMRLSDSLAGRVALERRIVAIPQLASAGESIPQRSPLMAGEGFAAYFGFPLIAKGEVKGVLELYHRAPLDPDPDWLEFLETLAGQAAIALDNTALFEKLQRSNLELVLAYDTTLEGWSRALDLRDKETEGHTLRVTETTVRLARAMGLSEAELVHVRRGALLHDIGKMGVPDKILLKPGPLNEEEWVVMRKHPVYAYELLSPIGYLRRALDIPYCHHEKWDGTGYPRGLKGDAIPVAARIFAVVDVWDALRSDRPYRAGWPDERVREHIRALRGTHFDPQGVDMFLDLDLE